MAFYGKKNENKLWCNILRLFQNTFGTHPEQPSPTGYKPGFLS